MSWYLIVILGLIAESVLREHLGARHAESSVQLLLYAAANEGT